MEFSEAQREVAQLVLKPLQTHRSLLFTFVLRKPQATHSRLLPSYEKTYLPHEFEQNLIIYMQENKTVPGINPTYPRITASTPQSTSQPRLDLQTMKTRIVKHSAALFPSSSLVPSRSYSEHQRTSPPVPTKTHNLLPFPSSHSISAHSRTI